MDLAACPPVTCGWGPAARGQRCPNVDPQALPSTQQTPDSTDAGEGGDERVVGQRMWGTAGSQQKRKCQLCTLHSTWGALSTHAASRIRCLIACSNSRTKSFFLSSVVSLGLVTLLFLSFLFFSFLIFYLMSCSVGHRHTLGHIDPHGSLRLCPCPLVGR